MLFSLEHRFSASVADVEAVMCDPQFYEALGELPDIGVPEVLAHDVGRVFVSVRVGMRYTGDLDPLARRVLRGHEPSWIQQIEIDRSAHRAELKIEPEIAASLVRCNGDYTLESHGDGTVRHLHGEFNLRIPLVGKRAEEAIGPGIVRRLDLEAEILAEFLAETA